MAAVDIPAVLAAHAKWRRGEPDGKRANLRGADLRDADLGDADLGGADLRGANLESAWLPGGWAWWQGGAYGPRRRMIRVLRTPDRVTVMAGCIAGTADDVARQLRDDRHPIWADEVGQEAADRALAQALALIELGVATAIEEGASK